MLPLSSYRHILIFHHMHYFVTVRQYSHIQTFYLPAAQNLNRTSFDMLNVLTLSSDSKLKWGIQTFSVKFSLTLCLLKHFLPCVWRWWCSDEVFVWLLMFPLCYQAAMGLLVWSLEVLPTFSCLHPRCGSGTTSLVSTACGRHRGLG